nr:transposase, MuDR, MULE transposase domain protein [Tanacetum cinerariifolium]
MSEINSGDESFRLRKNKKEGMQVVLTGSPTMVAGTGIVEKVYRHDDGGYRNGFCSSSSGGRGGSRGRANCGDVRFVSATDVFVVIHQFFQTSAPVVETRSSGGDEVVGCRQESCLITGFAFGKIPKADTFHGLENSPFCERVFPDKISKPLKKVRVLELLGLIKSPKMWYALSDEDSVKVTLLLVSNIVFMDQEPKDYIVDNLIELWKKDPLVIPRGLSWSKIGKFKKGDYGALFAQWSNPIMCMAPTSTELLQPWLIRSMDYFLTLLVDQQPDDRITASPHVLVYTSEELVTEYHSITTSVKLIENVGDNDPSIVLKELAAVKQRMNAIERFIKSRNDNMSEDSVAKQSVKKETASSGGKPDSAISDVCIGEISCENLVQEQLQVQLQSRDMFIQSIGNQSVQHPLESPNGKRPESSISDVLNGELSFDKKTRNIYHGESTKNEVVSEEIDPKEYDKNVHESGDGKDRFVFTTNFHMTPMTQLIEASVPEQTSSQMLAYTLEYTGFNFDNTENDSLSDMVKTGEEEIHLDRLEKVDDPFVQTPVNQNSEEISMYVNEVNVVNENEPPSSVKVVGQLLRKRFVGKAIVEPYIVQPPTTAPSIFVKVDRKRHKIKARMPKDVDWSIASSYLCSFVMRGDIPGWVCNGVRYPVNWADVEQVFFSINKPNEHYYLGVLHIRTGVITFLYYKCGLEVFEVKDEDDVQYFVSKVCGQSEIVQKLCVRKIKEHKQVKLDVLHGNDFDLNMSLFPNDYNNQTAILLKWQFNTFIDMPIPPPPPQPYIKKSHVEYNGISVGIVLNVSNQIANETYTLVRLRMVIRSLKYLGTNLLAVGMDGNNQILPLATGVSRGETDESWTWFLTKLKEQIGEPPNLCIISDRHVVIIQSYGKKLCGILCKACKAYTTEDFDKAISKLRGHRPIAVTKLEEACIEKWSRAYCPTSRYNYMTSNSIESINSLTMIVHIVPITMLVEYCRDLLQRWYCKKRHKYKEASENVLSDWVIAKVYDRMLKSADWTVRTIDQLKLFQVINKREPTQRRKTVRTNSLFQTQTTDEHLSKAARMDEERLRNGRVYMDWDDVQAIQEPVTTEEHVKRKEKEDNVVLRYQALKRKPQIEAQDKKNMMVYLKNMAGFKMDFFKGMSYDDIRPIFEKYFNSNVAFLEKSKEELEEEESRALKRKTESFEEKAVKKQKLDEDIEESKKHLQIVPNDEDDVYTEATPLAL